MLPRDWPVVLFMPGSFGHEFGKMGYGVLRYSPNPIACVYDPDSPHSTVGDLYPDAKMRPETPIVKTLGEVLALNPKAAILGIAPSGGLLPEAWKQDLGDWAKAGLSIVNGLHDRLADLWPLKEDQWVWDLRQEPEGLLPGTGKAAALTNRRVLMVGTDMAIGKMTAGLELVESLKAAGRNAEFLATGQIGITITGSGIPLDAVRVDYATGAVEAETLKHANAEFIVVEGQGSLVHPGSTATLPLLRGSMPTHLLLCHRAGQTHLRRLPEIKIPDLVELIRLYEDLATVGGAFPAAKVVGLALHPGGNSPQEVSHEAKTWEDRLGLPVVDPVAESATRLAQAVQA